MLNYWDKGLHDAEIVDSKACELEYDYKDKNPIRNCLILSIDSTKAMFDTTIKAIKLYNYKILSALKDPKGIWWKDDKIEEVDNHYVLTIFGHNNEEFKVKFEKLEIER